MSRPPVRLTAASTRFGVRRRLAEPSADYLTIPAECKTFCTPSRSYGFDSPDGILLLILSAADVRQAALDLRILRVGYDGTGPPAMDALESYPAQPSYGEAIVTSCIT